MCGLTGMWSEPDRPIGRDVAAMTSALIHRGPDAQGTWTDAEVGIALGHRRLAVLDVSAAGAQPMTSECGRFVLVFNGEIYNHLDLRRGLAAHVPAWRGNSDTETLLAAIVHWDFEKALNRIQGMFAFALWDRRSRRLTLARDRMGEKPLYYGTVGKTLVFASELKAIRALPDFDGTIDYSALSDYLRYACVPTPATIFQKVKKLHPGRFAVFATPHDCEQRAYWSLEACAEAGEQNRLGGSAEECARHLEKLLRDVVGSQMLSDVPLGVFLSGGIDSSLIAALMCANAPAHAVRTFSIGFNDKRLNEAPAARAVARHLGTDHTEMIVDEDDAAALVPSLASMFDEPFADSSAIPTALLCRLTRKTVTVALSGDGGDELFGGYNRHVSGPRLWRRANALPGPLRRSLAPVGEALQHLASGRFSNILFALSQTCGLPKTTIDKVGKIGGALGRSQDQSAFYREIVSTWIDPNAVAKIQAAVSAPAWTWPPMQDPREQMMLADALGYLPDDILVKVDRSAMAASLETRAPFLDVRVVEEAWRLRPDLKISDGVSKSILRNILYRHVPQNLVDRPKQGFAVPLDAWLRGRLRDWAENLISKNAVDRAGLFEAGEVRRIWAAHTSGRVNAGSRLWTILMAQAWHADATATHAG